MESLYPPLIGQLIKRYPHWPLDPSCSVGGGVKYSGLGKSQVLGQSSLYEIFIVTEANISGRNKMVQMNPHGIFYKGQMKNSPIYHPPTVFIYSYAFSPSRCLILGLYDDQILPTDVVVNTLPEV